MNIINIPQQVTVSLNSNKINLTGPLGTEYLKLQSGYEIILKENQLEIVINKKSKKSLALLTTLSSLIKKSIIGVSLGYRKHLQLVGVGFKGKIEKEPKQLVLRVGLSHPVHISIPEDIDVECPKPTTILIKGCNLQKVNHFAAQIRDFKKPEPYKGKGIFYRNEEIRLKEGKKG
jgi:large subunit ribosomal protein L6